MSVTAMLLIIGVIAIVAGLLLAWALAVAAGRGEIDERRDK